MVAAKCLFAFVVELPMGHTCRPHEHPCTELVFSAGSAGQLIQGATRFAYDGDSCAIYQPGVSHYVENQRAGRQLCVGVSGCGAETIVPGVIAFPDSVRALIRDIDEEIRQRHPLRGERLDLLAGLLAIALRRLPQFSQQPPPPADHAAAAKAILDERFDEDVSMQELAAELFVSPDYLRQLFRQRFGQSPLHYLIRRRLEGAQALLRTSAEPVQEIARRCGIDNPYYFSRLFRKYCGVSPQAYRARERTSPDNS